MTTPPQLSIIIPTRNEAQSIDDAIRQFVPFLEKFDLEIVISDAESTDDTPEKVQKWASLYPHRVHLVQKLGKQNIAIGRNFGAAHARGSLLFHTDADVRLPDVASFFTLIFEQFAAPQLAAATSPIKVYPEERTAIDRFYHGLMNTIILISVWLGWCWAKGECQIIRRSAFEKVGGYDENLVAGEDCNLFFRLKNVGKVRFFNEIEVHHSPRRFRQLGYWRVSHQYLMEGLSRLFLNRSFAREWKVVR